MKKIRNITFDIQLATLKNTRTSYIIQINFEEEGTVFGWNKHTTYVKSKYQLMTPSMWHHFDGVPYELFDTIDGCTEFIHKYRTWLIEETAKQENIQIIKIEKL